jgi:hypothetical protein
VSIRVIDGLRRALPNAAVRIYLMPFDHGHRFTPTVLGEGRADASGFFRSKLDLAPVRAMLKRTGGANEFNALVVAADPRMRWSAFHFVVLSISEPVLERIPATTRIQDSRVLAPLSMGDLLAVGPVVDRVGARRVAFPTADVAPALAAPQERWPDVATLSASSDERTQFTFSAGGSRETKAQIATSVGGAPYSAGGFQLEAVGRTAGAGPAVRSNQNYQYIWEASYQFRQYANCPHGICTTVWWEADHWTGGIRSVTQVTRPAFDAPNSQRLNVPYWRSASQTKTYGTSFNIAGVNLDSIASYETHTRMDWSALNGVPGAACSANNDSYIFGNGTDWPTAPVVWSICT